LLLFSNTDVNEGARLNLEGSGEFVDQDIAGDLGEDEFNIKVVLNVVVFVNESNEFLGLRPVTEQVQVGDCDFFVVLGSSLSTEGDRNAVAFSGGSDLGVNAVQAAVELALGQNSVVIKVLDTNHISGSSVDTSTSLLETDAQLVIIAEIITSADVAVLDSNEVTTSEENGSSGVEGSVSGDDTSGFTGTLDEFTSVEVVPSVLREVHIDGSLTFLQCGSGHQGITNQELRVNIASLIVIKIIIGGELEENGSKDGTSTALLQELSIVMLEDSILEVDVDGSSLQQSGSESPRFLGCSAQGVVVSREGIKDTQLEPSGAKLFSSIATEAADIRTSHGHTIDTRVDHGGDRKSEEFVRSIVITGPVSNITSRAVERRSGEDENEIVNSLQEVIGGLAFKEAESVVGIVFSDVSKVDGIHSHSLGVDIVFRLGGLVGRIVEDIIGVRNISDFTGNKVTGFVHIEPDTRERNFVVEEIQTDIPEHRGVGVEPIRIVHISGPD